MNSNNKNRIFCEKLTSKIIGDLNKISDLFVNNMTIAFGGQMSVGSPKLVPLIISKKNDLKLNVLSTSNNNFIDEILSNNNCISKRFPMSDSKSFAKLANNNEVCYVEQQMNKVKNIINNSSFDYIDFAVIEALCILDDGSVVPTASVGLEPFFLQKANKIIIEINTAYPMELIGIHDIYIPRAEPIPITKINDRIGSKSIPIDINKVEAIVFNHQIENPPVFKELTLEQEKVCENLISFLINEKNKKHWIEMPPIQTGFGNLAYYAVSKINESSLKNFSYLCGHLQSPNMESILLGKCNYAMCSSIEINEQTIRRLKDDEFKKKIVLRNSDLINNSEIISRFSPIAITSGIEIDIYGNANLSHISGCKVVNGLGGGPNFAENSGISIFLICSESKNGSISNIVPMVTHQDISEHDIDVVITENGVADLRGLSDIERAEAIICNCSNSYKEQLYEYFRKAKKNGGHHPVLLEEAFSWHLNFKKNGTMKLNEVSQ